MSLNMYDIKIRPKRSHFFKYIIYVHNDRETITIEDCKTGKIATSSVYFLNTFIKNIDVKPEITMLITGPNFVARGFSASDPEASIASDGSIDNIEVSSKVEVFQYLTSIPYATIRYDVECEVSSEITVPYDDVFRIQSSNILTCRVPYLPTFGWWNSLHNQWGRLMFYYNNEFYTFPYGNIRLAESGGGLCFFGSSKRIPESFIAEFNATNFNLDLGLGFRCPVSRDAKDMVQFDIEQIEEILILGSRPLHLYNIMYYMSHKNRNEIPWDQILLKVPDSWFNSSRLIKEKCLELAKSLVE